LYYIILYYLISILYYIKELTRHLELLELHKRQEIVVNSYHMHGGSDYTPTFDYIIKLKSKQIIVDCDIASVKGFLNKALERQMLTGIYHYHFLSLVRLILQCILA